MKPSIRTEQVEPEVIRIYRKLQSAGLTTGKECVYCHGGHRLDLFPKRFVDVDGIKLRVVGRYDIKERHLEDGTIESDVYVCDPIYMRKSH